MSLRLKIEHGQDAGKVWRLKDAGSYVVGRDATSAIRVLDMKVSKGHCEIHVLNGNEGGARIRDLKSTHGTQLNGQPLAREMDLKPGDEIRLGFTVLRMLSDGPADAIAAPSGPLPKPEAAAAASPPAPAAAANEAQKTLPPDELVGKTLGGYRVIRKIGQGGMGSVYMAEQVSLKREVALKVLSEKFVADSAFVDQFLNEARAAGQLNHPNVVQVYDVGQVHGRYFFSMEYVPGGAIEDRVKGGRSADWPDALNWFLDATNALIFAQKRGILHRDVKPDNLMLSEDGSAKLCDLGLAKKSESQDLLAQGIIGTPHFLSPEAIRRKPDIDHRTDLYSLGCTFYRILAGENPYPAKTVKDILLGHLNKPVPRITDRKPDVPKDLSDVVYRLMQKEPAQRHGSADEVYTALDKIRIQHGLAAHGIQQGSKKPLVIAAIVALLAAAAVIWVVTRPKEMEKEDPAAIEKRNEEKRQFEEEQRQLKIQQRDTFFSRAEADIATLVAKAATDNVEKSWANESQWKGYFEELAELRKSLAEHPDYRDDPELASDLEKIDAHKREIERQITFQRTNASKIDAARQALLKDLSDTLTAHQAKYDAALTRVDGQVLKWWEAAALVARGAVEGIVEPLRKRAAGFEVGGQHVELMKDKDIDEKVRKAFPGTDWAGQDQFRQALGDGDRAHKATLSRIAEGARERAPENLEKTARELETYRDAIPEPAPALDEVNDALRDQRKDARNAAEALRKEAEDLYEKNRERDRSDFHRLVKFLREPGKGRMAVFAFARPIDEAQRLASELRDPAYRRRGAEMLADDAALEALFTSLRAAFEAKGWAQIELEDEAGKLQKVTEVAPDGLTCPVKTKRLWVDFGARFLLERLFYVKPDQPRFAFGANHRGLAVLSELAGHPDLAAHHWKQYGATLTSEQSELLLSVDRRVAALPREMQAAEMWKFIHDGRRQILDYGEKHRLPKERAPITGEQREAILREHPSNEQLLQDVLQTFHKLHMDEELASTLWGTSFRDEVHPRAAYGGETVPASVKGAQPIKLPEPAPAPGPGGQPGPGGVPPPAPGGNGGPAPAVPGNPPPGPGEKPAEAPKEPGK